MLSPSLARPVATRRFGLSDGPAFQVQELQARQRQTWVQSQVGGAEVGRLEASVCQGGYANGEVYPQKVGGSVFCLAHSETSTTLS